MREISKTQKLQVAMIVIVCSLIFYAIGIATDFFGSPIFSMFFIISEETAHNVATYLAVAIAIALSIIGLSMGFIKKSKIGFPEIHSKPVISTINSPVRMAEMILSKIEEKKMTKKEGKKMSIGKSGIIGMHVIDGEGNSKGIVQDITFAVGKTGMTLVVASKEGDTSEFAWEDIQAAGEFVLLKAKSGQAQISSAQPTIQQPEQEQSHICPTCGEPLTFIPKYNRWYCYNDKKYV